MAVFTALASPIQEPPRWSPTAWTPGPRGSACSSARWAAARSPALAPRATARRGLPRHRALPIATVTFSAGMAVVALTPWLWLGLLGMAFSGAFWIWMFAATNTAIQLRSPRALLGRMLGLYQLSVIGPIAIGSTAAGAVAERAGIAATLAGCAALLAAWGAWSLRNPVAAIDGQARANRAIASNATSGTRLSTETK